jgi:uncharacterized membrane protein YccC
MPLSRLGVSRVNAEHTEKDSVVRSSLRPRLVTPDWMSEVVPDWLADVVRPKKAPIPWADMIRAVFAIWVPLAAGFITGHKEIALLPAMGGLLSVMIDQGGPYWLRVRRIAIAGVFGGAAGLAVGLLIHGRGWIAVAAIVVVAGVSAILARLGAVGSVTGLQLAVYSSLGLGPIGTLRPWWHTALEFIIGVAWALLLITPSYLRSPHGVEQRDVAAVYHALANDLRAIGTSAAANTRRAVTAALNTAYDAVLTSRSAASGRSTQAMRLVAILNVSHEMAEATTALRTTGERPPPWVTGTVDQLADAVLTLPAWRRGGASSQPAIPPPWSSSPGALELRDAIVALNRAITGSFTPPPQPAPRGLGTAARDRLARVFDQLIGGRIAWLFTIRLMLCMGVAAVLSEVAPIQRSYWVVLTVAIILKPDYGSVFARALQRGIGTIVGAVLGAAILAVVPDGPWLLLPFGVLAALLPYGKARSFGLSATFLTPFVVLLIDLLTPTGWRLAGERLIDTVLASAIVLLIGYAPWPVSWSAHLPRQFADTLRAVAAYMDEALVTAWDSGPQPVASLLVTTPDTTAAGAPDAPSGVAPGQAPSPRSGLRRSASRALSDLRAEFQRTLSEPPAISRRAAAWWPALVGLEEVMDATTTLVVEMSGGAPRPAPDAVHQLTGMLRGVADAIEAQVPPAIPRQLPDDPALTPVTDAVRLVVSVLSPGGGEQRTESEPHAPAPA